MVQLNRSNQYESDTSALSFILLSASMLSFVITFLGIKLKWFRHRLTFDQAEVQAEGTPVLLRTTSVTEFRENCARGVYRRSEDAESLVFTDNRTTLNGQAKTSKSSDSHRSSIFRLPFKSKFSLTKFPSTEENSPSNAVQPESSASPSVLSLNRDQDIATLQKNEHLKRMIHETLKSKNFSSMSDMTIESTSQAEVPKLNGRLVEQPVNSVREVNVKAAEATITSDEHSNAASPSSENIIFEQVMQKKVKFEEINEIENTIYETQFEHEIEKGVESSIDPSPLNRNFNHHVATVETVKPSAVSSKHENDVYQSVESFPSTSTENVKPSADALSIDRDVSQTVDDVQFTPTIFEKIRFTSPVNEFAAVPPTPMKRKSREDSFNKKPVKIQAPPLEVDELDTKTTQETATSKLKARQADTAPRYVEVQEASVENEQLKSVEHLKERPVVEQRLPPAYEVIEVSAEQPVVKPRARQTIETTSEEISTAEVVSKAQHEVTLSAALNSYENLQKLKEKFADSSSSSSMEDESEEETVVQHVEVKVVPKSILKTSETSGTQKSITFQNTPDSIRYQETSSSESEDEDVWSRMNQHRFHLTRINEDRRDSPPPLPKTPPPTFEEEKKFSFA